MATTRKPAAKKAAPKTAKTAATRKRAAAADSDEGNGAKATKVKDKLGHMSEVQRRNAAKLIYRERSKSPATSWPDIMELLEDKGTPIPGSMTGRRLMREYLPDGQDAESAIIKQDRSNSKKSKTATKKRAPKKVTPTKKRRVVDEDEEEEDEDLEEEEEDELEDEDEDIEDEEDEDFDEEDEEDEDEEEEPEPPKAKRVRVQRGRGKKANPSK